MQVQHLVLGLFVAATAIPSIGNLGKFNSEVSQVRAEADRMGQEMNSLKLSQQEAEMEREIANERYASGCLPVVDPTGANYVTLVLNGYVVDKASEQPLPVGAIVCDAHGNTGVVKDDDSDPVTPGVVQDMAFTGDRDLIVSSLSKFDPARYASPMN
jgi:outer membrane murein-binding lipoprotein Lpp